MMKLAIDFFATIFVGAVLGGILWLCGTLLVGFSSWQPPLQAALVGGLVALIVPSITFYLTKAKDAEARFFVEKRTAYLGFVKLLTDVMQDAKRGDKSDPNQLAQTLLEFKRHVLVWGSGAVIQALQEFESGLSRKDMTDKERLMTMDNFLRALRKDLGHSTSTPQKGGLMSLFLIEKDRAAFVQKSK